MTVVAPALTCTDCETRDVAASADIEDLVHATPLELAHEPAQTRLHRVQVDVVPETRAQRCPRHARLLRVDLPRMEVKDAGLPVARIDASQRPAIGTVRQQPEIAAAPGR